MKRRESCARDVADCTPPPHRASAEQDAQKTRTRASFKIGHDYCPPVPQFPRIHRPLLVLLTAVLLFSACSSPASRKTAAPSLSLIAPARPIGDDVLPRWRTAFDEFGAALGPIEAPLIPSESADSPLPEITPAELAPALALLDRFVLAPGETLVLPSIHGPETPFPDHQPLRQIATLRTVQARLALAAGNLPEASALVRQNLAQARATLATEEGIIPMIHALSDHGGDPHLLNFYFS